MQLVKQMLKTFKYIKNNKKFRNKTQKAHPWTERIIKFFRYNLPDIILTDKTLMSSKNENEKLKEEGENKNENEKLKEENENENENENEHDETMRQNEIKELNGHLDEIIGKSKSFEDQIKSIKKVENLEE